jgi:diaminohydroxyphosphoribosylaminopyrimidine deaminase/5-amino-6-(5-phosphoribosylamino)uracil reductase
LRIIADAQGRTPASARVLKEPGRTLLAVDENLDKTRACALEQAGVELIRLPSKEGLVDLKMLFKLLGQRQVTSVLAEGGGQLLGSLFDQGLVDKVVTFISPMIIGGTDARMAVAGRGVDKVSQALRLRKVSIKMLDQDVMVTGYTGV